MRPTRSRRPAPAATTLLAAALLATTLPRPAAGQTPYAPVASAPGEVTLSFDSQLHADRAAGNGWVWALPGVTVGLPPLGVPGRWTAGARLSLFEPLASGRQHDFIPQLSWLVVDDTVRQERGPLGGHLRVGATAYGLVPVTRGPGSDASAVTVLTGAWMSAGTGTTLVFGGYYFWARARALGDRAGAVVEGAQPLGRVGQVPVAASVSWFQGRNLFGYLTGSLQFTLGRQYVLVGWAHGNQPRDNTGPALSWGMTF